MISNIKYIGMDVHKESISIAVMNSVGKVGSTMPEGGSRLRSARPLMVSWSDT
jgi:hypothetical protein